MTRSMISPDYQTANGIGRAIQLTVIRAKGRAGMGCNGR